MFVEAHTVGQDDWTTLPDTNGNTSDDTGGGCPDDDPFWLNENPFLRHYITRTGTTGDGFDVHADRHVGAWNAATGNSAGFQDWEVDLSAFAGKQVEVSITYATDPAVAGARRVPGRRDDHADGATRRRDLVRGRPRRLERPRARRPTAAPTPTTGSARRRSGSSTARASPTDTRSTGASASRA